MKLQSYIALLESTVGLARILWPTELRQHKAMIQVGKGALMMIIKT